ncbi:MAG: ATP-dependent nuclease subunit B-like protein [Actinomycetia bacterium]|nr:ATP-dependent nuclease subunit B-like protein [Actinomycetes bacterium]
MGMHLVTTPYGRPAAEALRDAVARHKHDDPLRPVSVVVPTNYVGVSARRMLADGTLGPVTSHGAGVVGITFLTLYRLAELLGAPRLAGQGRRPVSTPVLGAAVRQELAGNPGLFRDVAEHPTTEQSLVAAHRELSNCSAADLDRLTRASARAADVVRVHRAVRRALADHWFDERDLMDAAIAALEAGSPVLADIGALVCYLPQAVHEPAAAMVRAVASRTDVVVIAGNSGVERADALVDRALQRLGLPTAGPAAAVTPPHATRVYSASDADDEVRAVVRAVMDALREGVPLERMAILYGSRDPYGRLVSEQLDAAGVAYNGAAVRRLAESVLGRSLLALLALPDHDFRRQDVIGLLGSGVAHHKRAFAPSAAYARVSRRAGVVAGVGQWSARLARFAGEQDDEAVAELAQTDHEPRPHRYERDARYARGLLALVTDLARDLDEANIGPRWSEKARWAHRLVHDYLADDGRRAFQGWPDAEQRAADQVESALDRLAGLDRVEPAPTLAVFRRTLELELDAAAERVGRLGDGIVVGNVSLGMGLDLDRVFVLGLAEGTFPSHVREDSLLPDAERRLAGDALALRAHRTDDDHRMLLAALASTRGERVLTYPRGDLRRSTQRMPSRFLRDTVEALCDRRLAADELERFNAPWLMHVPSFAAGIARASFPATEQEYRLRDLLDHTDTGTSISSHSLRSRDVVFDRAVECTLSRASKQFTRFDGNLSHLSIESPTDPHIVVSPTRLEAWAACPHEYLMGSILRVEIPERPEELYEISPLDKGSLMHAALDRFLAEVLARPGGPPESNERWPEADRRRLAVVGAELCDEYEARGLTGRHVFWDRDRRRILADLDRFLSEDDRVRATDGLVPVATEFAFGLRGEGEPVEVPLSDGRSVRFRGSADRVDRAHDDALVVVDYKTGGKYGYTQISEANPDVGGRRLQLPVYAHAVRKQFGEASTPVEAAYWFITSKQSFARVALPLTRAVGERIDDVLRTIVDGIGNGVFPCRVEPPTTSPFRPRTYIDPDARGTRDRYREWQRKRDAPKLAEYVALADPVSENGADDD